MRYCRHRGRGAKAHSTASTSLHAAGKVHRKERGGQRETRTSLVNHVKGSRWFPTKDVRRGFDRPYLLWHPTRATFATKREQALQYHFV